MRQPVQGADTIAELRDEPARLNEVADAAGKIIHRRVDQRDDQHFLFGFKLSAGNDLRGEGRERVRLARAGHGRNAKRAALVGEDLFLSGARSEGKCHVRMCQTPKCVFI